MSSMAGSIVHPVLPQIAMRIILSHCQRKTFGIENPYPQPFTRSPVRVLAA
jgi:hypothetical protein